MEFEGDGHVHPSRALEVRCTRKQCSSHGKPWQIYNAIGHKSQEKQPYCIRCGYDEVIFLSDITERPDGKCLLCYGDEHRAAAAAAAAAHVAPAPSRKKPKRSAPSDSDL